MHWPTKRRLAPLATLVVAVALLAGCRSTQSTTLEETPLPHVRAAAVVSVAPRPRARHLVLLEPARRARLAPRVGGQVVTIDVDEEQRVGDGDVLIRFAAADPRGGLMSAKAAVRRIQEQLRDNERDLRTIRGLAAQGAEATRSVERLETSSATLNAQLREAQGQLLRAKDKVGATALVAPFAGTVTTIDTEVGEYLGPGAQAMVLSQLDPLALEVPLSEAEAASHDRGGLRFEVTVRDQPLEAELEWVSSEAQQGTSTFVARLVIDNPQRRLRAGEAAEVHVYGAATSARPAVPATAVRWSTEGSYVLRLTDDTVHAVGVTVLDDSEDLVTIAIADAADQRDSWGLSIGDEVVATGPVRLTDGDQVVVARDDGHEEPLAAR